jgi:signal transduction histidine kinase
VCTHEVVETPIIHEGQITAIVGVGRDITQEVTLEQKLWDTEEDRRSTLDFALRTSMGLVKGYVYTLESGDVLSPDQRKRYSSVVLEEIDNLSKIVDDLLDVHRLEENSLSFDHQVTDLKECVELALSRSRSEIERRGIELSCEIPDEIDPIHLPPDALIRILTNLIQNSIHHTMHNGRIKIAVVDGDDYVDISIIDNGMGIQAKDLPHIFEKYYRGDSGSAAAEQGAGLGLVVTRILVDALGGKIWVTSEPGEETEFRFVLPRHVGAYRDEKPESSTRVSTNIETKAAEVAE